MKKPINEIARMQQLAGIITENQMNEFEKTHKYFKITPYNFKSGDFFLRTPDYNGNGEFFGHKDKVKILSINLPKDGRGNTAVIKTDDGKTWELSHTSLYNIARPKNNIK
jgi:hypothetical protein